MRKAELYNSIFRAATVSISDGIDMKHRWLDGAAGQAPQKAKANMPVIRCVRIFGAGLFANSDGDLASLS